MDASVAPSPLEPFLSTVKAAVTRQLRPPTVAEASGWVQGYPAVEDRRRGEGHTKKL